MSSEEREPAIVAAELSEEKWNQIVAAIKELRSIPTTEERGKRYDEILETFSSDERMSERFQDEYLATAGESFDGEFDDLEPKDEDENEEEEETDTDPSGETPLKEKRFESRKVLTEQFGGATQVPGTQAFAWHDTSNDSVRVIRYDGVVMRIGKNGMYEFGKGQKKQWLGSDRGWIDVGDVSTEINKPEVKVEEVDKSILDQRDGESEEDYLRRLKNELDSLKKAKRETKTELPRTKSLSEWKKEKEGEEGEPSIVKGHMTEQEAADLLNERKIKTPGQQVAGEDDDFDLGKEKLRLMGMLAHDTTIGVQERAALRGEIFNADAESIKTIEAQLNASKQNTAPTQSKSSTPPPIPAVSPRPTAGAPAVNTPPNQPGGKQMFNTSWDRGMDRWREEQENKKTIRNISRDTIKDPVQKGFEEHARQKAEGKDAASLLEGALNKRKSFWDRNAGALGVMASPVKRLIEGYGKLDWKKRVAIGAAIGGAAALATGGLGTLGYGLLAGAGRTGAGMAGGALGGELSRKFFATDTVRAWAESNPKKAALAHVVGAMGGGVLMAMLFNEFGSPQLASLVSGPSEQMLAFPDTLPDDSTPGTIVDPSSAGNTATEIPTAPEVPAEAPTSAAESSAPMMRVAPESMAGANAAAPSFADAHVIPGNEIAPDAENAPTAESPSNDSAHWIDYADRYDPYVVVEGDAAFARGLWGHMMDNMAGVVHTDAFAEFIGTVVPEASHQSFIQALHKTLIGNPEFMNILSGGSMTPNDIVLEDGMYYTLVHNGDQIKLAELFKNDDFVKAFGETIKGGNFSTLQVAMDNGGGVDTILERLHTQAGDAEEGAINIGAEVAKAQSSLAGETIGIIEPSANTPQTVLDAQEAAPVGVLENIVSIPAGYESVAGQLYDILFKDITTTTPEEVKTQFVARIMEELSGRGIGPEIAISELSTEAGPDVIKSVLDDMNTDGISFSDRVWLEGMYKGQVLPETGIPKGAINV